MGHRRWRGWRRRGERWWRRRRAPQQRRWSARACAGRWRRARRWRSRLRRHPVLIAPSGVLHRSPPGVHRSPQRGTPCPRHRRWRTAARAAALAIPRGPMPAALVVCLAYDPPQSQAEAPSIQVLGLHERSPTPRPAACVGRGSFYLARPEIRFRAASTSANPAACPRFAPFASCSPPPLQPRLRPRIRLPGSPTRPSVMANSKAPPPWRSCPTAGC